MKLQPLRIYNHLNNEWLRKIPVMISPVSFNNGFALAMESVNAQAVLSWLNRLLQAISQCFHLRFVHGAFKHGKLNALPMSLAYLGNPPQPGTAWLGERVNVVSHENIQLLPPVLSTLNPLGQKRNVAIEIAAQVTGQQACLEVGQQAEGRLLF